MTCHLWCYFWTVQKKIEYFSNFSIASNPLESHFFHQYFHNLFLDDDLKMFGNCFLRCRGIVLFNNTIIPLFLHFNGFYQKDDFAVSYPIPWIYMEKIKTFWRRKKQRKGFYQWRRRKPFHLEICVNWHFISIQFIFSDKIFVKLRIIKCQMTSLNCI